ncbi:MAG: hypothetical protein HYV04_10545 [Deltaproteobacteria bacterium]|nr:hypothetical protein [Deltaproteobacteria bacterium]
MKEKLKNMDREIKRMREAAEDLRRLAVEAGIPAVIKNTDRVLASLEMLALNISDPLALEERREEDAP